MRSTKQKTKTAKPAPAAQPRQDQDDDNHSQTINLVFNAYPHRYKVGAKVAMLATGRTGIVQGVFIGRGPTEFLVKYAGNDGEPHKEYFFQDELAPVGES